MQTQKTQQIPKQDSSIDALLASEIPMYESTTAQTQQKERNPAYMTLDTATDSLYQSIAGAVSEENPEYAGVLDPEQNMYGSLMAQAIGYGVLAQYIQQNPEFQEKPEAKQVVGYLQGMAQAYVNVLGAYANQMQPETEDSAYKAKDQYK
jgi:hypothetical protein